MRNTFSKSLTLLAENDPKIILLVGDIGFNVFDKFIEKFPNRFINCGVAEANMIGTAAGLAMSGFKPVVYTIIPFLIMRTFEQIRVDLCMHDLQVTLVGVGGGLSYDSLGPTHHATEDVSIMRSLPNMQVFTPSDPNEVEWLFPLVLKQMGPKYFRLGKGGEKNLINESQINLRVFGKSLKLFEGEKVSIISHGPILNEVLQAREILLQNEINPSIISINTIKNFNKDDLLNKIKGSKFIVTVEEHSVIGGLGDIISDCISEIKNSPIQMKIGIEDKFVKEIGSRDYQLRINNLKSNQIANNILNKFKKII